MPVQEYEYFELKSTLTGPSLPFFVVIITTPSAAREPYSAEAAAPLRIDMFSISSGLMSMTRLPNDVAFLVTPSVPEFPLFTVELS